MIDILSFLPGKRKQTSSGWTTFNAPCCVHNGESQDKRSRGGIITDGDNWSYHCFNCGFKASFKLGRNLSYKARKLLGWLGVDQQDIERINLESMRNRTAQDLLDTRTIVREKIKFEKRELPEDAELLTPEHTTAWQYVTGRGLDPHSYPFMVTPTAEGRQKDRIIIPFTHDDKIVGFTSRYLDNKIPKYISEQQQGYVFGVDLQDEDWSFAIAVEGVLDAVSISGLGLLHNTISKEQAEILKDLRKEIIVVPDQDEAGVSLIDRAVELGFSVSIPAWPDHIKDVADAVQEYGKLGALLTIVAARESSRIKIELAKKALKRRL